ncbi:thiolase family protein [Candidatus Chlorohelix sp.]|uniref:thiolase family protein n=1 Tax=Candidatus Chlorohelix sp. TaxID=3139201 RepID=UPI00302766DF
MDKERQPVIVAAVRTPAGKRNGKLKNTHATNLAAAVLREVVQRAGIQASMVDQVFMGCVSQVGEQAFNIARNATLMAGFPIGIPATSLDFQCGSSQQAIHLAASMVLSGYNDIVIAAGVESMSRVPMGSSIGTGKSLPDGVGYPFSPELMKLYEMIPQGLSAELLCQKWNLSREELDRFSMESHSRAAIATAEGRFKSQIMPLTIDGAVMATDEGIRPETTLAALANLKPAFHTDGKITAGNSSQISDGAAAVLVMSRQKALELGLHPRAAIIAQDVVGSDPTMMLTGPIEGTHRALNKAGLLLSDIDRVEINEAFAPVVLAWAKEHNPDMSKVNVNGGAIALGHPLGASGARLMTTLLYELEFSGGRFGLQTMCCGGGMATTTIIERL